MRWVGRAPLKALGGGRHESNREVSPFHVSVHLGRGTRRALVRAAGTHGSAAVPPLSGSASTLLPPDVDGFPLETCRLQSTDCLTSPPTRTQGLSWCYSLPAFFALRKTRFFLVSKDKPAHHPCLTSLTFIWHMYLQRLVPEKPQVGIFKSKLR